MPFNTGMDDKQRIHDLGGPTRVAELLNLKKHGGAQRVQNWLTRGSPARVKLAHPELFPQPAQPAQPERKEAA